jgi:DNA-binding CsgD family transcriptional regulator/tetratricopeptide (TPR) repeat protein
MEAAGDTVHPPLFRRHARRPRLTRLLDESTAQAIVITAPAGYGKTTLATEWLQGRGKVLWYRSTSASADVAAFSAGLSDVISELLPGTGERLKQRLRVADTPERAARPLAELLADDIAAWPKDALLVVDDYQLVADSAPVEDFFDWLLTLSPQLRVLVTSRRRPRWASARRILYCEITEIGRDQLAMNAEEAARVLGDDRSSESVRALVRQAEGWPALIGLAALTASREIPTERVSEALYRYFAEEVVRGEAPEVERFMLLASVPATVDARIAREVLGLEAPETALKTLIEEGLLHMAGGAARFHPLLRAFLRKKLEVDEPELHSDLAQRAITDARRNRRWEEAIELGVETDRAELTAEIIGDSASELLASGKVELLERWLDECGPDSIQQPGAVLARAEILTRKGHLKEAAATASALARRLDSADPKASRAEYVAGRALHLMSREREALECHLRARSFATDDIELSDALWGAYLAAGELGLPEAVNYLNELESLDLKDLSFRFRVATGYMASAANEGSLKGIASTFEPLMGALDHLSDPMIETSFLTRVAEVEVLRARYEPAVSFARRALLLAEELHLAFARPLALVPLIAGEIGLRRFASARKNLFALSEHAASTGDPYLEVSAQNLELRLQASNPRSITSEPRDGELDPTVHMSSRGEHLALLALHHASRGNPTDALDLACRARETSKGVEATYYSQFADLIAARRTDSVASLVGRVADLIRRAAEHEVLDSVVIACRSDPSFVRLAGEERSACRITSRTLMLSNDRPLLEKAGLSVSAGGGRPDSVLTPRELEVFRLLGRGYSNAAIAEALVISLSTAKVHVHHILEKLGVQTRLQAALRASEIEGDL